LPKIYDNETIDLLILIGSEMIVNYDFKDNYTEFASAKRSPLEQIMIDKWNIENGADTLVMLDAVPMYVLVLNNNRQIVYSNKTATDFLTNKSNRNILGLRPGEAIGCKHAFETGSGCGTSNFCSTCGSVNSILKSINGEPDVRECRISETITGDIFDLRVWTTPTAIHNETYHIFALKDIADENRRKVLERIFFHDIMNLAGGLRGIAYLLNDSDDEENKDLLPILDMTANNLIDEINAQKMLIEAESNLLAVNPVSFNVIDLFTSVLKIYKLNSVAEGKQILIDENSWNGMMKSDFTLLKRVIGNMVKNALEATPNGKSVCMNATLGSGTVILSVHNDSCMPSDVKLQMFQRSFSTKGTGRGLGTYSVKMLTEKYLEGTVRFESSEESGTTFFAEFPLE
jgi:hypothetical protein